MKVLATVVGALVAIALVCPAGAQSLPTFDDVKRSRPSAPLRLPHCTRQGSLLVSVGLHILKVSRNILLRAGKYPMSDSIPCGERRVEGQNVTLDVNPTFAGDVFYKDWIRNVRMPTFMNISAAGYVRTTTADEFKRIKESGWPAAQSAGVESVATKSTVYYRLDRPESLLFISCSTIKRLHVGHICSTAYRFGDFDIRYRFSDVHIPQSEWLEMDVRFRRFLQKLEDDAAAEKR